MTSIFSVGRKTIYNWFTRWEDEKLLGLYNNQGRGRKPKLNDEQKKQVKAWAKKESKALSRVVQKTRKEWGITISKESIKRIIKKLEMRWKRMKRGLSKEPYDINFVC